MALQPTGQPPQRALSGTTYATEEAMDGQWMEYDEVKTYVYRFIVTLFQLLIFSRVVMAVLPLQLK